jgi:hypothetical protein
MILVVHTWSQIRILTFYPSRIPDPGVKKALDPGSGSATPILSNAVCRSTGYGQGLILCQLLPGKEYKGMNIKPAGYDSRLVQADATSGWSCSTQITFFSF